VEIIVYADESGIHDLSGQKAGSQIAVVCGFMAWKTDWDMFAEKWENILRTFSLPYFHFSEIAGASAIVRGKRKANNDDKKNPFVGWNSNRIDDFLKCLAAIIKESPIVGLGYFHNTHKYGGDNLRQYWALRFYSSLITKLRDHSGLESSVTIYFDQTDDVGWSGALIKAHEYFKPHDSRIKAIEFADKKVHIPLQAADLFAHRTHQVMTQLFGHYPLTTSGIDLDKMLEAKCTLLLRH
jgi:uncharacterized protein DUF3800